MESIIKTFIGKYIDISKIVSISDAIFIDRMGSGGWFVGFEIHIQLLDKPIWFQRAFTEDEYEFDGNHKMIFGNDGKNPLAVERLQIQIDELVEQWKAVGVSNNQ